MPKKQQSTIDAAQRLLTIQEASTLLNCHPNTLRKWDRKGILHAIHVGKRGDRRYKKQDLLSLLHLEQVVPSLDVSATDVIEQIAEGYVSWDKQWRYTYVNKNAANFLQIDKESLIGKPLLEAYPKVKDTELYQVLEDVYRNKKPTNYVYYSPISLSWIEAHFFPTRNGIAMYFADLKDKKRLENTNKILLNAHSVLSSSLDYKKIIQNLGKLVVPELSDWFTIEIINKKGELEDITILHKDKEKIALARKLRFLFGDSQQGRTFAQQVLKTGKSVFYPHITKQDMEKSAINNEHLQLMQKLHFRSVIVVPLIADGKVVGIADFILSESTKEYDKLDVKLAEEIGRIAGMSIAHAKLYKDMENELREREKIEQSLRQSEKKLDAFLSHSNDSFLVLNKNEEVIYRSQFAYKVSGYSNEEVKKVGMFANIFDKDRERVHTAFKKLVKMPHHSLVIEYRIKHKNGKIRWVESTGTNWLNEPSVQGIIINFRDITEKKEMEYRKDEFISIASHELKTPLTSLKVYTQYLQKHISSLRDPVLKKYLDKIGQQTDNLTNLVSDLLDISKIQKDMLPFTKKVFNFNNCIKELVEVANTTQAHRIMVKGDLPLLYGDEGRLCQVIDNLISNAMKYSPNTSPIKIILSSDNMFAKVCVKDYGIGIEKEYHKKIFEKFFRAGDISEHTYPGLGIGLHICSQIIKRHDGKIWVESEKGKGSTFCFTVPIAKK